MALNRLAPGRRLLLRWMPNWPPLLPASASPPLLPPPLLPPALPALLVLLWLAALATTAAAALVMAVWRPTMRSASELRKASMACNVMEIGVVAVAAVRTRKQACV